jgi:hypothetical protein
MTACLASDCMQTKPTTDIGLGVSSRGTRWPIRPLERVPFVSSIPRVGGRLSHCHSIRAVEQQVLGWHITIDHQTTNRGTQHCCCAAINLRGRILVNRGWVPLAMKDADTRRAGSNTAHAIAANSSKYSSTSVPSTSTVVPGAAPTALATCDADALHFKGVGVIRRTSTDPPSRFTPINDPFTNTWFWLDIQMISELANTRQLYMDLRGVCVCVFTQICITIGALLVDCNFDC